MTKKKGVEYIVGLRPIIESINTGKPFSKVYIRKGLKGQLFRECFKLIREQKIPFQYVPGEKLNALTKLNHQGIIAVISPISFYEITQLLPSIYERGKDPYILILDGITDIRNFGGIARSAEAAGVDAIIIGTKKSAVINADAIKTSAGALNRIPVCREENIEQTLDFLKNSGITLYGASEKAEKAYYKSDYSGPVAVVMGSEDKGLSQSVIIKMDFLIKIPMYGNIASLNVGIACGIIIFEIAKQKHITI